MYTGHMIDQLTRKKPRFPSALEGLMAAAIRNKFEVLRPLAAYGSAACGSDILCLEAMREVGGETHIVLPFPADEFHRVSVDFASGGWGERFERALAAADSVTITSDHRARGSSATFEYANLVLSGMAHLRAQVLNTDLRGLAVWDGRSSAGGAGAASLVRIWQSQNVTLEQIRMPEIDGNASLPGAMHEASASEVQPAGFSHEIRAMLFADAVGYSALSEDQTLNFINQFLGAVADLNARSGTRRDHRRWAVHGVWQRARRGILRPAAQPAGDLHRLGRARAARRLEHENRPALRAGLLRTQSGHCRAVVLRASHQPDRAHRADHPARASLRKQRIRSRGCSHRRRRVGNAVHWPHAPGERLRAARAIPCVPGARSR
jgi:hypothetical protein